MKLTRSILMAGSIVTLATVPAALAGGGKGADAAPAVEETTEVPADEVVVEDEVVVDEGAAGDDAVVDDGEVTGEPEIAICDRGKDVDIEVVSDGEPTETVDPAVCEMTGGPEVQRGEDGGLENPDVIFQTTALDGAGADVPVAKPESGFGSDERAADIQKKSAGMGDVKKQKKGPVALVKQGRVFLR